MYKKILLTCCVCFLMFAATAQNVTVTQINVLAKSKNTGVWLRWAPANHTLWQLGNKYGYTIERLTLKPDGDLENKTPEKLTLTPLKPLSENEMEKLSERVAEVSVIQELIYGEDAKKDFNADNLGSVIKRNRELENSYGIALLVCDVSRETAQAAALFFEDKTAIVGKRYIYRISLAQQPQNMEVKPGVIVTDHTIEKPMPVIRDLNATFGDHKVTLSWPTVFHKGIYSAYYIEKSEDGKKFQRTTDLPYVNMSQKKETESAYYLDSLNFNNKTFYYRVIGISPFAELSNPSTAVSGQGTDNLIGLLIIREGKVIEKNKINIVWEFPVNEEKTISGYILSRANNPAGPFTDVNKKPIAPYKRDYQDETPYNNTYYQIRAINKAGIEVSKSFAFHTHVEDNTPPAIPVDLSGAVDKNGIVTLKWKANTDKDIMGYRVFISNSLQNEAVEATKFFLPTPDFIDTINIKVLNKKVFYTVVAVDKNFNNSDYSKPLMLLRPDVIAPAAPVLTKTDYDKQSISLEWINSVSDDVARYELSRKHNADTLVTKLAEWRVKENKTTFADNAITLGQTYQYILKVYDSAGNMNQTISRAVFFETGVRKAVTDFKALINREAKSIKLQWKKEPDVSKYVIYRRKNDDVFRIYKTFETGMESFEDTDVKASNVYAYKIQIVYTSGVKSILSEELEVKF
ncbi:MAG TPA: hypothetical protein VIM65_18845 [Cyclobacteriaceae bacterium]